jgi:dimethylglycine dehydrogenase
VNETARVVIVGGGVMGVSLAYHLCVRGWRDVVLLEARELTAGSTWHAAGLCTFYSHSPTIMDMRAASVRLYRDTLPAETGLDTGFHQCGALRVTRAPDRMDEFRHVADIGEFVGYPFHTITPSELADIYPLTSLDGLIGALYEPNDGHVDPTLVTQAMAASARAAGARFIRNSPVSDIERTPAGEWRVVTSERTFTCEHVVNAAGTWCREVGDMMGIDLPVVPMLHQYLVTDAVAEIESRIEQGLPELPMIRDLEESWYLRQERNGFIVGPYEAGGQPWSIDGVPPEFGMELLPPDLERVEHIVAMTMERVPALAQAGIKTIVNGPITFTPDANPLVGPAFGLDNAWLLTGSSMGIMEGGGAGRYLANWMVDSEPPMDPIAVDPRRFGDYADRQYRVDKAVECFGLQFGVHYPFEERPAGRPARVTTLVDAQRKAGAVFGCAYGWERPNWFNPAGTPADVPLSFRRPGWRDAVDAECLVVRDAVGLVDLSAFSKFEVRGVNASQLVGALGANTTPRLGRIGLTHALNPSGGIASEFTVSALPDGTYYLTSAAAAERRDHDLLRTLASGIDSVDIVNVTTRLGIIGVMGPQSRALLSSLSTSSFANQSFPWLSCATISVAGVEVRALRVSYVGELGWELHVPMAQMAPLYTALRDAGETFGVRPFGMFAVNAMRLEKGYRAWGTDLTTERTPLESGLGFAVKTQGRDFVGKEALLERASSKDAWSLDMVAIDCARDMAPFYSHTIYAGDEPVGVVTSAAYGARICRTIGLAWLRPMSASGDGTMRTVEDTRTAQLQVSLLGQRVPLIPLSEAAYDPHNTKLKCDG